MQALLCSRCSKSSFSALLRKRRYAPSGELLLRFAPQASLRAERRVLNRNAVALNRAKRIEPFEPLRSSIEPRRSRSFRLQKYKLFGNYGCPLFPHYCLLCDNKKPLALFPLPRNGRARGLKGYAFRVFEVMGNGLPESSGYCRL